MPSKDFKNLDRMNIPLNNILQTESPLPEPEQAEAKNQEPRAGSKYVAAVDPYNEPRSRRVQLLMRPSLYSGLKYLSTKRKQSINNLIEGILLDYIDQVKQDEQKP